MNIPIPQNSRSVLSSCMPAAVSFSGTDSRMKTVDTYTIHSAYVTCDIFTAKVPFVFLYYDAI